MLVSGRRLRLLFVKQYRNIFVLPLPRAAILCTHSGFAEFATHLSTFMVSSGSVVFRKMGLVWRVALSRPVAGATIVMGETDEMPGLELRIHYGGIW